MHDAGRRHERIALKAWQNCEVVRHEALPTARAHSPKRVQVLEQDDERKALVLPRGDEFAVWGGENIMIFQLEQHGLGFKARDKLSTAGVNWWTVSHDGGNVLVTGVEEDGLESCPITCEQSNAFGSPWGSCYQAIGAKALSVVATPGRVAVADDAGHITLFELNPQTGQFKRLETWRNVHRGFITLAAYQDVLVAGTPEHIQVWDCQKRLCLAILPVPEIDHVRNHILCLDSDVLVASRLDSLHVYARQEHMPILRVIRLAGIKIRALKLLYERKALVGVNEDGTILLVCLQTGNVLDRIQTPLGEVYSIDVLCDARLVLTSRKAPYGVAVMQPTKQTPLWYAVHKHSEQHFGKLFVLNSSVVRRQWRLSFLTVAAIGSFLFFTSRLLKHR